MKPAYAATSTPTHRTANQAKHKSDDQRPRPRRQGPQARRLHKPLQRSPPQPQPLHRLRRLSSLEELSRYYLSPAFLPVWIKVAPMLDNRTFTKLPTFASMMAAIDTHLEGKVCDEWPKNLQAAEKQL